MADKHRIGHGVRTFLLLGILIISIPIRAKEIEVLENKYLKREISVKGGVLKTVGLENRLAGKPLLPLSDEEFRLILSENISSDLPDICLTAKDFKVLSFRGDKHKICAELENRECGITAKVYYTLSDNDFYGHKYLEISSKKRWDVKLIDLEAIAFQDVYQPYRAKDMMWTTNKFLPALGQPLYTSKSATFWGVEFSASWNRVSGDTLYCGYQNALELRPGQTYTTYKAVFGVGDDGRYIKEAFLDYIDRIRAIPFGLHIHYNSWFDFGGSITQKKFLESLNTLHRELVEKRGCKPLDVYVIDDAWQNSRPNRSPLADWSQGMYKVNELVFDPELKTVREEIEKKGSKMGLWASPACLFGATPNLDVLHEKGFETLVGGMNKRTGKYDKAMCMTGEKYLELLEEALLRMARMGAEYFKLDGIFGNMKYRFFPVRPGMGTPVMEHLLEKNMVANDPRLNDARYDEMKRFYITRSTERLISIFQKMRKINPRIRIMCHNGATISPWWLMTTDVLSLVNQQDGAQGKDRNSQLCYRDAIYYQTVMTDNNQIPINSIFNHEPSKDENRFGDTDPEVFRNYFFMSISRGTAMVELYFKVKALTPEEFDIVADGLKWLHKMYPAFKRSRMHGSNPLGKHTFNEKNVALKGIDMNQDTQVYGYTGWTKDSGYVSIHNPKSTKEKYSFTLNRDFGLIPGEHVIYSLSSPMPDKIKNLKKQWRYGDTIEVEIDPKDVLILDFESNLKKIEHEK
ncbi:hypothetical protein [Coprobacter fastidiosus]